MGSTHRRVVIGLVTALVAGACGPPENAPTATEPTEDGSLTGDITPGNPGEPQYSTLPGILAGLVEGSIAHSAVPIPAGDVDHPFQLLSTFAPAFLRGCTDAYEVMGAPLVQLEECASFFPLTADVDGDRLPDTLSSWPYLGCDHRIADRYFEVAAGYVIDDHDTSRAAYDFESEITGGWLHIMADSSTDALQDQCTLEMASKLHARQPEDQPGTYVVDLDISQFLLNDQLNGDHNLDLATDDTVLVYHEADGDPWPWQGGRQPTSGTVTGSGRWTGSDANGPVDVTFDIVEPLVLSRECANKEQLLHDGDLLLSPVEYGHLMRYPSPIRDGVVEMHHADGNCNRISWLACGRLAILPCSK